MMRIKLIKIQQVFSFLGLEKRFERNKVLLLKRVIKFYDIANIKVCEYNLCIYD